MSEYPLVSAGLLTATSPTVPAGTCAPSSSSIRTSDAVTGVPTDSKLATGSSSRLAVSVPASVQP